MLYIVTMEVAKRGITIALYTYNAEREHSSCQAAGAAITGMGFTQLMALGWVDNGNLAGSAGETVIYISRAGNENAGNRLGGNAITEIMVSGCIAGTAVAASK